MRIPHTVPEHTRFEMQINYDGPLPASCPERGNCWLWTGSKAGNYGIFEADFGRVYVHRYVSAREHGPLLGGIKACHHCDTPLCVRGTHLFRGTQADNLADMRTKGREARGDRHGLRLHPGAAASGDRHGLRLHPERNGRYTRPEATARGERTARAKLTEVAVRLIRQCYADGGITQQALANNYGVPQSAISAVILRKTWKHVP